MRQTVKAIFMLLHALLLGSYALAHDGDQWVVYPPVPGLAASPHYSVRVRPANAGSAWQSAFAWETVCKKVDKKTEAYFDSLAGWTHTYVNFETAGAVEVEISRADGQPLRSAAVHPKRKASACSVKDGKVLVTLDKPCLVAVDIDGQMDGQDTGKGYKGPPIHAISIFANPLLTGKPKPSDPGVLLVKPGEMPPSDGPWTTLYFLPGVHDVGLAFPLRANRQYYIPGDAMVYGTLSNRKWGDGHHIRIFGLGTLSGARTKHPKYVEPAISEKEHGLYRPIELVGTTDTRVEGITIADSATHSLMLVSPYKAGHPNAVTWTKIFTWRANGDGINPFGNTLIEDCFIRTQDDSLYVNGLGIRRTVLWNDANGSSFVLSALPNLTDRTLVVEDCDVIYARAKWHRWSGGRVFNMRGEGGGAAGAGVIFRNINIEDPRPTLQQFFICMTMPEPYSKDGEKRKAGDVSGIRFQNISIAAPSVLKEPQILWGQDDARISNLTFENLTLAGKPVLDASFFKTNAFVDKLTFIATATPPALTNSVKKTLSAHSANAVEVSAVAKLPRIRVDAASKRFVDATGQRFTPCGVSYYRPGTGWAPQLWKQFDAEATRQDFQRMKRMGMNVARVFVTFGSFYTQPGQLDASGLATFDRMLDLADEAGIYLHPTGPEHWEGMPPWAQGLGGVFDNFANEACLKALEDFWTLFAGRYRGRTTIWAYDLRNEPTTAWDTPQSRVKWDAWRTARQQPLVPVPDKTNAPSAILADYQRFRESLAEAWVARQAKAIRAADPQALVTVGLIQWSVPAQPITLDQYTGFRPEVIDRHLDFLSLHFYPLAKGVYRYESQAAEDANLAVVEAMTRECAKPGKPVVIAEFGWYGGGPLDPGGKPADEEQQARWCKRLVEVTAPMACGWINWGLYDMPEAKDVSRLTGLITTGGVDKAWGKTFGPLVKGLPPVRVLPTRPDLPWENCTMDNAAMTRFQAAYLEAFLTREQ